MVLQETGDAPKRMAVNVEMASFYSGPGTNYELLWQAEKYYPVLVCFKKGNWYQIMDVEGDIAYIDKSFLGEMNSIITTSKCLESNSCTVLSLPEYDSQAVFTFDKGVPFKVLSHRGAWLKIEHGNGSIGWIEKRYVW